MIDFDLRGPVLALGDFPFLGFEFWCEKFAIDYGFESLVDLVAQILHYLYLLTIWITQFQFAQKLC